MLHSTTYQIALQTVMLCYVSYLLHKLTLLLKKHTASHSMKFPRLLSCLSYSSSCAVCFTDSSSCGVFLTVALTDYCF